MPSGRHGGVLSAAEIERLVDDAIPEEARLIAFCASANLRDASYEVRVAADGLVRPDNTIVAVGEATQFEEALILHPGDSAWLSTHEQFCLPSSIAGMVTLRAEFASRGLFLLSGTLIAPRYGMKIGETPDALVVDGKVIDRSRLHFFVVNFGARPIVVERNQTLASVQFLTVMGELRSADTDPVPTRRQSPLTANLGFIESLKDVQKKYESLARETRRNSDLMRNLIVVGYFVLGTAVIGASLSTILSISASDSLVADVHRVTPHTTSGKALVACVMLSAAIAIYAFAWMFGPQRLRPADGPSAVEDGRREAIRRIRARAGLRCLIVVVIVSVLVSACGFLAAGLGGGYIWLGEVVVCGLAIVVVGWQASVARMPPTAAQIRLERDAAAKRDPQ